MKEKALKKIPFNKFGRDNFILFARANDEYIFIRKNVDITNFPGKEFVISRSILFNGVQIDIGDKVILTGDGLEDDLFLTYCLGEDAMVLSHKKKSSKSSFKWLLEMMANFI